ncbi:hypothetical protein ACHAXT_004513 [Thalassiosira profunda]
MRPPSGSGRWTGSGGDSTRRTLTKGYGKRTRDGRGTEQFSWSDHALGGVYSDPSSPSRGSNQRPKSSHGVGRSSSAPLRSQGLNSGRSNVRSDSRVVRSPSPSAMRIRGNNRAKVSPIEASSRLGRTTVDNVCSSLSNLSSPSATSRPHYRSASALNYKSNDWRTRGGDDDNHNYGENESPLLTPRSTSLLSDEDTPDRAPWRREEERDCRNSIARPSYTPKSSFGSSCSAKSGTTGLDNLGNTCFMNACLQCLAHCPSLADYFLDDNHMLAVSGKEKIASCFAEVVEGIYQPQNDRYYAGLPSAFSPDEFLAKFTDDEFAPQFAGSRQHDSHEFLRVLIDQLCEDLKDLARCKANQIRELTESELDGMDLQTKADYWWSQHLAKNSSFITDEFCGQMISSKRCTVCGTESHCFDPFYDLSLPFPEGGKGNSRRRSSMLSMSSMMGGSDLTRCSLDDCLREFCKDEVLDGDNMTECSKCREKRECVKRLQVHRFPKVLVLHLKRFGNSRKKVRTSLNFPVRDFDASALGHADGSQASRLRPVYDLFAVCNHSGRMNFGHYTASCIDAHSGAWYEFNDENTSELRGSLNGSSAYVLFYRQKES